MRIVIHIIITGIMFLHLSLSSAQTNIIYTQKGIDSIPFIIDESTIDEVVTYYGNSFKKTENGLITYYNYKSTGITFGFNPTDANKVIRNISVEAPFIARTNEGIILNESTMKEVQDLYNKIGCFTDYNTAYFTQQGITFYIHREPSEKGFNINNKIFKIEVNSNNIIGIQSNKNFKYDEKPGILKFEKLYNLLQSRSLNSDQIESLFKSEFKSKRPLYTSIRQEFSRELEFQLQHTHKAFRINSVNYKLNYLAKNDSLVYTKLTSKSKIIFEKKYSAQSIQRKEIYKNNPDLSQYFPVHVYGTFCGVAGTPPPKCKEMLQLVNDKQYMVLTNWLNSANPEISAYGYAGLTYLQLKGNKIRRGERELMEHISQLTVQLNTCKGCFFGERETFKEALSAEKMKDNYSSFKQYGWLQ